MAGLADIRVIPVSEGPDEGAAPREIVIPASIDKYRKAAPPAAEKKSISLSDFVPAFLKGERTPKEDTPATPTPTPAPAAPASQDVQGITDPMGAGLGQQIMNVATPTRVSVMEGHTMVEPQFNADEAARLSQRQYAEATPIPGDITDPRLRAPSLSASDPRPEDPNTLKGMGFADSSFPVRAAARAAAGIAEGAGGTVRAVGDMTGSSALRAAGESTAAGAKAFEQGMGEIKTVDGFGPKSPVPYLARMGEGAASSLAQTAAMASLFGHGAVIPMMSIQSAGQHYNDARTAGKSPLEALTSSIPYGIFEAVGEKFTGLDKVSGAMGTLLQKGASIEAKKTAGEVLIRAGIREIPGEVITYLGQTGVDLLPGIGLNPKLTMSQFLDGLRDTVVQAGMMGAGVGVGGAAVQRKQRENAEQAAINATMRSMAPDLGLPEKALAAALDKTKGMDPEAVPGFLDRFTQSLAAKGLIKPRAPGDVDRALRDARHQAGAAIDALQPKPAEPAEAVPADEVLGAVEPDGHETPVRQDIEAAAHAAATSPLNDLPEPTQAQKDAGNYPKGHINVHGLDVSIENPRGSTRTGTSPDGTTWESPMNAHYGYFLGTIGNDKDHVDTFVGPNPDSTKVFVVDQVNKDGTFDEHKVMLGFDSLEQADRNYHSNYEPGWTGRGAITEMPIDQFKTWVKDGAKNSPLGNIKGAANVGTGAPAATVAAGNGGPVGDNAAGSNAVRGPVPDGAARGGNDAAGQVLPDGQQDVPVRAGQPEQAGALSSKDANVKNPATGPTAQAQAAPAQAPAPAGSGAEAVMGNPISPARAGDNVEADGVAQAQRDAHAKRAAAGTRARAPAYDKNPLMAFIAKHGLFHDKTKGNSLKSEFSPDKAIMVPGYPPVFRKTGHNLDLLVHRAIEEGFLRQGQDTAELHSLIQRAVGGEKIIPMFAEGVAEAEGQREAEARAEFQSMDFEPRPDGYYEALDEAIADMDAERAAIDGEAQLTDAEHIELEDNTAWDAPGNASTEQFLRAMGASEQEIKDAIAEESRIKEENNRRGPGPEEAAAGQAPGDHGRRGEAPGDRAGTPGAVSAQPQQTPADAGVSVSGFTTEKRADGTLSVGGKPMHAIMAKLREIGIPDSKMMPGRNTVIVAKTAAKKVADALGSITARSMTHEGRATDGKPIMPGDTFTTASGRVTTPYPKQKGEKYASQWTIDNAVAEAEARGDTFNAPIFKAEKPGRDGALNSAARASMLEYLFGQQPAVVPSILKPLVPEGLTAPTPEQVIAQQDRKDNQQALDDKAQIDAEAAHQTLTIQTAPDQRQDTTGDIFGGPTVEDAQRARAAADAKKRKDNGPGMFDEPAGVKDMEQYIKVAADSIEDLRKTDVFRVLVESNRSELRNDIAEYIKSKRPDLVKEVNDVMAEQEPAAAPAWHTQIPAKGLAVMPGDEKVSGATRVVLRILDDGISAITQQQKLNGSPLYAYVLPSTESEHGMLRFFPDDQTPPKPWRLVTSEAIRIGMLSPEQIKGKLQQGMMQQPILTTGKPATDATAPSSVDAPYKQLLALQSTKLLSERNGRKLYEVTVSPAFRNKHFTTGRGTVPIAPSPSFELKLKSDVTGNPHDAGYILIDKRATAETPSAPTAAPAAAPAPNPDALRAAADLNNALADLADIFGKDFKANMLPEQEQKLLPVLTRLFDAAFRLGYIKFKDAAKFALDKIRAALGDDAADALTLDHMQGAYISMAGGRPGADTKRAVIDIEDKAEIEAHTAQVHNPATEETSHVSSPDIRVERDSGQPAAEPAVGNPVPPGPRAADGRTGQGREGAGVEGGGRPDDSRVPADGPAAGGERGGVFVHRGNEPAGSQSSDAGDLFGERGGDSGLDGVQLDPIPAGTVDKAAAPGADRLNQQRAAASVAYAPGLENIKATLPYLLEPQQEDVHKAETRFAVPTGTGTLRQSTAPLDTVLRTFGGSLAARVTSPAYAWLARTIDALTPEAIKAGVVSDYGLRDEYLDRKQGMKTAQRQHARHLSDVIDGLQSLDRQQSRVAYLWMQEHPDSAAEADMLAQLPEESRATLAALKNQIDDLGQEAVRLGMISAETIERNRMAYLHRSYKRYETEDSGKVKAARGRAIKILGDQFKGRGLRDNADMGKIAALDWYKRKTQDGKADTSLKGQMFHRLERRALPDTTTPDMVGNREAKLGKLREVVYWPVGEPMPRHLADWRNDGQWEARFFDKSGKVGMWRDFTLEERTAMGEIQEVRYGVAKTIMQMSRDVETARFLDWIAKNEAVQDESLLPPDAIALEDASTNLMRAYLQNEWVQIPSTAIPGTGGLKRYGNLAGRWVPGPVWNDLRQISSISDQDVISRVYGPMLRAWKISKTALSPATHMNNVMSNFIMADAHDVQAHHMLAALRAFVQAKKNPVAKGLIEAFQDNGGDAGMFNAEEIKNEIFDPLLKQLEDDLRTEAGTPTALMMASNVFALLRAQEFRQAAAMIGQTQTAKTAVVPFKKLIKLYGQEDELFRLAAFIKAREDGLSDHDAGKFALESFLNYEINAPWIAALRKTWMPFVAFTYRAAPMMAKVAADKPWKVAKWMMVAGALNALGYLVSGGDEDKERAFMPDEKNGRIWGLVPKLIRMPWNDAYGQPVFLDIRRWIPVGDMVDMGQSHSAVPIPPPLMPGGPGVILGEIIGNTSLFTGQDITKATDTLAEKWAKMGGYLWKSAMPNMPGLPGTYSTDAIVNAGSGKMDNFGREQSMPQALASSVGVKIGSYPGDVMLANTAAKLAGERSELIRGMRADGRQLMKNGLTKDEFDQRQAKALEKLSTRTAEFEDKKRRYTGLGANQ